MTVELVASNGLGSNSSISREESKQDKAVQTVIHKTIGKKEIPSFCGKCGGSYPLPGQNTYHRECARRNTIKRNKDLIPMINDFFGSKEAKVKAVQIIFPFRYKKQPRICEIKISYDPSREETMDIDFKQVENLDGHMKALLAQTILSKFAKIVFFNGNDVLLAFLDKYLEKVSSSVESISKKIHFTYKNEEEEIVPSERFLRIEYSPGNKRFAIEIRNSKDFNEECSKKLNNSVLEKLHLEPIQAHLGLNKGTIVRCFQAKKEEPLEVSNIFSNTEGACTRKPGRSRVNEDLFDMVEQYLKWKVPTTSPISIPIQKIFYSFTKNQEGGVDHGFFTMKYDPEDQTLTFEFSQLEYDENLLVLFGLISEKIQPKSVKIQCKENGVLIEKEKME